MTHYAIVTDLNRCVGCLACSVACKAVNNVPIGNFWNKTLRIGPNPIEEGGQFPDVYTYFLTVQCQHCENPACMKVCPTGATYKDDKGRVRISLSRKQAEGDPWADVANKVVAGSVMEGKVVRTAPFGAFVELAPGIEGLVHISELSWTRRVHKAEDVVNVGDVVNVKVKEVNPEARRISLSLRDAEGDPWQDAASRFAPATVVTGTVESRAQFGLFVNLAPGITGLLPAGVIKGCKNAAELNKLDKGDSVTLTVQNLDTAARRISLAPEGYEGAPAREDHSWKQHASTNSSSSAGGLNTMAQALQKAMQNKR